MAEIRESIVLEVKAEGAQQTSQQLTLSFDRLVQSLENIERNLAGSTQSLRELAEAERRTGQAVQKTTQEVEKQGDAIDKTNRSTERAGRTLSQFSQRFQATASAAQSAVGPLTRIATIFAGGLGVRAVSESLASFERGLTQVQAISRATVPELERIRQTALDLGATTSKSASEALQGAVELARAGFSAVEVPEALPATLNLAVTAQLDLGRASEIAANSIRTFGLQAGDTVRVTDALTVVANNASTDVQQLADALSFAGPLAASFGLDIEQTAAALGAISDGGIKASRAGTGLAGILRRLVDPSKEAREEFDRINVAIESLDPRTNDFADVVDRLGEAYRNGADFTKVFEAEQLASAITLARLEERFDSLLVKQRESVDAAGAQADAFGQDLRGSIDRFRSTVEALVLKTGDQGLTGALQSVTEFGIETVSVLGDLDSSGRKASDGANLAASAIEGAAAALGSLIALAGGASFISALANPFVAAAAAIGALVTASRLASRELEDLARGSVKVAESIQNATRNSAKFADELSRLNGEGAGLRVPRTLEDSERLLTTLINRTIQLAEETKQLAIDPVIVNDFGNLNQQIQETYKRADQLQQQFERLKRAGPDITEFGPDTSSFNRELAQLKGQIRDVNAELDTLVNTARQSRGVTFIPIGQDIRTIAAQAGLLNELAEAEKRAADGVTTLEDRLNLLDEAQKRLTVSLEDVNGKTAENARVAEEAAAAVREQAAAEAELNQQKEQRAFEDSTQAIQEQIEQIERRTQAIRDAGSANGAFLDVLREQQLEDAALALQEQEIARLKQEGIEITNERAAAILIESSTLVASRAAQEDLIKSLTEELQAREKLNRQADRKETSLEQREAKIAAQRAAQAQEQAAGIARALQLEAQSYGRTREEVERLRLEEQLRGLEVSNNLKDEIRLIQQQTEEIRKSREAAALVGSSLAGGVGDALRTLRDSGSGADALIAGLQGVSDRIFQASIAQIEQALTSVFTDAFAVPTAGESLIVAAVNRVEAAVLQSTTIGVGVGAGLGAGPAGGVGPPVPAGFAATGVPQGGPVVAGAQADRMIGPPIAAASAGDFYGPPVPQGFQFAGQQQSFWQGFQANFGPALATTAASFAFSAILSRFAQRDREEEQAPGFRVLGLGERFAGTGYNDNRRVTNYISPTQRSQQQTFRQEAEQRTRRF